MLIPAIARKEELDGLFMASVYSEDYFWYSGYLYAHELPISFKCHSFNGGMQAD